VNGRYPSNLWNGLATAFLCVLFAAIMAYAPWVLFVGLLVAVIAIMTTLVIGAALFTRPQVSDTRKQEDEKT
jgi:hypothetical protein